MDHLDAVPVARNPAALWRRSGDRVLVLPPGSDEPLLLEGTGAAAFLLLDDPVTLADLAATFAELTGTEVEVITRDLRPFLDELAAEGVLATVPDVG